MAEKAFVAFLECDTTPSQTDPEACCSAAAASVQPSGSAHLPIGAAASVTQAIEAISTAADAATAPALEACHAQLDSYDQSASTSSQPFFPLHPPPSFPVDGLQGVRSADMRSSPDATAARAWAQPPVELTVKHVGFLGSLAHALVHLQKASEGLSLLRAAACIMRTNPPAFHMWLQGSPDPQVLHAHVLMDLVSFANPATTVCKRILFAHLYICAVLLQGAFRKEPAPSNPSSVLQSSWIFQLIIGIQVKSILAADGSRRCNVCHHTTTNFVFAFDGRE